MVNKIRTSYDRDRLLLALQPVDEAFRASESRWGVARLERLVNPTTLASYRRGWTAYRQAITDGDASAVEELGPKMIQALAFMDREATALGHQPLSVTAWEAATADGRILVVVRTQAEARALARSPDGRETLVYTMEEIARLIHTLDPVNAIKAAFPGGEAVSLSGVQMSEGRVADWATQDPLEDILHGASTQ